MLTFISDFFVFFSLIPGRNKYRSKGCIVLQNEYFSVTEYSISCWFCHVQKIKQFLCFSTTNLFDILMERSFQLQKDQEFIMKSITFYIIFNSVDRSFATNECRLEFLWKGPKKKKRRKYNYKNLLRTPFGN